MYIGLMLTFVTKRAKKYLFQYYYSMKIHKAENTSFKALYLPKPEKMAKFAFSDRLNRIRPELENLAKDVDLYIKLPVPDVLSCREKLRCIMINPKYDNFFKKIFKRYKQGELYEESLPMEMIFKPKEFLDFLTKMKEALLKSNPKTGEVYKVYFSSVR